MATTRIRRDRRTIHDPSLIARLLSERAASGETYAALSARSGIPAVTLCWHANRRRQRERTETASPSFVELVATGAVEPMACVSTELRVIVRARGDVREVVVPRGFDETELQRVIAILESPC